MFRLNCLVSIPKNLKGHDKYVKKNAVGFPCTEELHSFNVHYMTTFLIF